MDITKYVEEKLKKIDVKELVEDQVRELITKDIKREIKKAIENRVDELIETEFQLAIDTEVIIDDGWGKKERYETFEDLFRKTFREKMNTSYKVHKLVKEHVNKRVQELYDREEKEFMNIFDEFLRSRHPDLANPNQTTKKG